MRKLCLLILFIIACVRLHGQILKVGIAGLSHDHAYGIMQQHKKGEVIILGIAESDPGLVQRYTAAYNLPDSIFFKNITDMLNHIHPDAVLAYNAISEHIGVIEACAPRGISVMVEKPLALTSAEATRIKALADRFHIQVLTNFETTWYPSNQQLNKMVGENEIGSIRKMIAHDGHNGPVEIGCSKEFLAWLTDPKKNGAGALMDFGCYGANLMTWLMRGVEPVAVTAITKHIKPKIYPQVDDDATIVLEYPDAIGIIEASWNWPYGIKDLEVFGTGKYLHALNDKILQERSGNGPYENVEVAQPAYTDNLVYIAAVLHGTIKSETDLSSLKNNIIVVRILEAARQSAKEGRRIVLK